MISEMNIAVSKIHLSFAKDGNKSAPEIFLGLASGWPCCLILCPRNVKQFGRTVCFRCLHGGWWCRWHLQVEYSGNMTDDQVVLKKVPTSSISIWGRLPCWLMFFWVETSRPHVLLLMALRDFWVWEKKLWELPVRFVCALGLLATNLIQQRIRSRKASKMGPSGHVRLNQLGPSSDCKNFW